MDIAAEAADDTTVKPLRKPWDITLPILERFCKEITPQTVN